MASRLRDWLELEGGPARLRPMEGLRGVAVLLVFLQHYAVQAILVVELGPVAGEVAALLRNFGSLGVELFFTLSGFLIYGTLLRRRPGFLEFMRRRVQRLYPVFLCVFVPFTLAHVALGTGEVPSAPGEATWVVLANLLFLPGVVAMEPVMTVAWTLSWEMAFYLVLGVAVPGLALHRWPRWGRVGLILVGMAAVTTASDLYPEGIGPFAQPMPALPFLFGMVLFEAQDGGAWSVPGGVALLAGVVSLAIGYRLAESPLGREWMETVALALLCSAAFRGGNVAARVLSAEKLRWLGNMSYSYYLVHGLVVLAVFRGLGWVAGQGWPSGLFWLLLLPVLAASVVASLVVFVLVERPFSLVVRPRRVVSAAA